MVATIGVLALQGGYEAHARVLHGLGAVVVEVRVPAELQGLDGLIIPGGESTTMTIGVEREGLAQPLRALAQAGLPMFGSCAGMIMFDRQHLGVMDIAVERNAFGRQVNSFEADLEMLPNDRGDGDEPLRAVFIRAPWLEDAGADVDVLAEVDGHPVLAREGRLLVAAFHPELTDDTRVHERFLNLVREETDVRA